MNSVRLFISKNLDLLAIIFIVILAIPAYYNLTKPGYFSMHDDVQIMRLFEMKRCFQDGQIPCRLVPDMGAGYGHPLYNYHQVFPYYLGMIFRVSGMSYIDTAKTLFLLSLVCSGVFMYYLAKEFFGKVSGVAGAILYIYAPYHSVDIYVRGALTETWGITFFPIIFLSLYKFIKEDKLFWFASSVISISFLFLSHNIMAMLFIPIALMWSLYWIVLNKAWSKVFLIILIFIWAVGLVAFFVFPAFFEQSFVRIESLTTGYYNFRDHFVNFNQLFIQRNFGYGPSILGPNDAISFQIGWPHWWLLIIGIIIVSLRSHKKNVIWWAITFNLLIAALAIFMADSNSFFIWNLAPIFAFVQFPWRFLALMIFTSSFVGAGTIFIFRGSIRYFAAVVLILVTVVLNFNYFQPQKSDESLTDKKMLSGEMWKIQSMATLADYVPSQLTEYPKDLAPNTPQISNGNANIVKFENHSNFWAFEINVNQNQNVNVLVPVFNFPNWEVLVDNKIVIFTDHNPLGLIQLEVPEGYHTVIGRFKDTPLRTFANVLSGICALLFIILILGQISRFSLIKKYIK